MKTLERRPAVPEDGMDEEYMKDLGSTAAKPRVMSVRLESSRPTIP
jgi:hypothetical protein